MSKLLALAFLFTSLALGATDAIARPFDNDQIRSAFKTKLEQLANNGVNAINGVPLSEILQMTATVNLASVPTVLFPDREGQPAYRRTAYWEPNAKTIYFSEAHLAAMNVEEIGGIMGHEVFRAVGIDDENLDTSALINCYLRTQKLIRQFPRMYKNPSVLNVLKSRIERPSSYARNGGISGVGGGGDLRSQQTKEAIIDEIYFDLDRSLVSGNVFVTALTALSRLRIEISPTTANGTFDFVAGSNTILVPVSIFESRHQKQNLEAVIIPIGRMLIVAASAGAR